MIEKIRWNIKDLGIRFVTDYGIGEFLHLCRTPCSSDCGICKGVHEAIILAQEVLEVEDGS